MEATKENILDYLAAIKPKLQQEGIEKIGLFGSFAKAKADLLSDIDIVIKTSDTFVKRHSGIRAFLFLDDLRKNIERHFGRKVDICDETGLKEQRVTEGKIYA